LSSFSILTALQTGLVGRLFEMALSTATFRFVDGHQFFAMDHVNPARVVSTFEGQLELTAIPRNTMQFDVFSEVFELVKKYGSCAIFRVPTAMLLLKSIRRHQNW
jgi:hypothetical protein